MKLLRHGFDLSEYTTDPALDWDTKPPSDPELHHDVPEADRFFYDPATRRLLTFGNGDVERAEAARLAEEQATALATEGLRTVIERQLHAISAATHALGARAIAAVSHRSYGQHASIIDSQS